MRRWWTPTRLALAVLTVAGIAAGVVSGVLPGLLPTPDVFDRIDRTYPPHPYGRKLAYEPLPDRVPEVQMASGRHSAGAGQHPSFDWWGGCTEEAWTTLQRFCQSKQDSNSTGLRVEACLVPSQTPAALVKPRDARTYADVCSADSALEDRRAGSVCLYFRRVEPGSTTDDKTACVRRHRHLMQGQRGA